MLSRLQKHQVKKKNNKGKTFVILDEQNFHQKRIEDLIRFPLHDNGFSEVFDTAYFGKSHYSKLIQIADLIAGIFRYYLGRLRQGHTETIDFWTMRLGEIISRLRKDIIHQEPFNGELKRVYSLMELSV